MSDLHIHWSRHDDEVRAVFRCPTCKVRRRFAGWFQHWYGITWTCCACGDAFADGERLPRPHVRGWRKESTRKAKELWNRAHAFPLRLNPLDPDSSAS